MRSTRVTPIAMILALMLSMTGILTFGMPSGEAATADKPGHLIVKNDLRLEGEECVGNYTVKYAPLILDYDRKQTTRVNDDCSIDVDFHWRADQHQSWSWGISEHATYSIITGGYYENNKPNRMVAIWDMTNCDPYHVRNESIAGDPYRVDEERRAHLWSSDDCWGYSYSNFERTDGDHFDKNIFAAIFVEYTGSKCRASEGTLEHSSIPEIQWDVETTCVQTDVHYTIMPYWSGPFDVPSVLPDDPPLEIEIPRPSY